MRFMLLLGVVLCACSSADSSAPPGIDDTGTTSDGGDPAFTKMTGMNGPKMVDALVTDFTPKPTSPLKKAGLTSSPALTLPTVDFFGTLRGTPPTIGAIE